MKQQDIDKLIRSGDLIITTRKILTEAVVQSVGHLAQENGEFENNRYKTSREYEDLTKSDCDDIAKDIIDYLTV